jgi:hypothetical protein
MITLTMTTCRRPALFKRTLEAFFLNCKDRQIISKVIMIDDNSEPHQFNEMINTLAGYYLEARVMRKIQPGHPQALNLLFDAVETDYIFMLEDDWEAKKPFSLQAGIDIIKQNENIPSVLYRLWKDTKMINGVKVHNYNGLKYNSRDINTYPGYTLNPTVQNIKKIREKCGRFDEKVKLFELEYATKYAAAGFHLAMIDDVFKHIGIGKSAYLLNGTQR